jgi:hypothetical protein
MSFLSSFRGASHERVYARLRRAMANEPGIHNPSTSDKNEDRGYGFRAPAFGRPRNDRSMK